MVGTGGVEPPRAFAQRCLRPSRLPFRHVPEIACFVHYAVSSRRASPCSRATLMTACATRGATFRLNALGMM